MFYIIIILAIIATIIVVRFIYNVTKSKMFIRDFKSLGTTLYYQNLPYSNTIRVPRDGYTVYYSFNEGVLQYAHLVMKDGAQAYWRTNFKYTTCHDKNGNGISSDTFEGLYNIAVSKESMLETFYQVFENIKIW